MDSVKERLIYFLNEINISKSEFGRRIGVSSAFVTSIRKSIQPDKIQSISLEFPELNIQWLLTGEGDMLKASEPEANAMLITTSTASPFVDVRYFEVSPSATFQEFLSDVSDASTTIGIPAIPGLHIDDSYCVFQVYGDSMAPQIHNKSRILCREINPTRWHTLHDCVIVIAYSDKFVIKRLIRNELDTANRLTLASDNPEFPDQHTIAQSDIHCIFQAVQLINSPIN